mmetsp:Transcript_57950/g.129201  ORF Transcript_57950/g.129201 Transcript_57950/m.129201 type:complete len:370 (-) Transcript_57950:507-1616(-)|eukprot:CAMPEP_0181190150 /NCGR_PEP_ID=MMETSP1096-20121128/12038_1 /TAXON_ID=156174 ORGANISM="Chrysochromulina ericina, Strain CCMP281" /NCGR_SAMPLE_ID=MMETSP1096 /ASSEMBLY_ACC=CAM_ASM_000453 /LENGTH=369 /DNA_ID=CAMNT_0023279343 /DNA_START=32 /DNA_END=1141 /DNA_ORIENTATION=-
MEQRLLDGGGAKTGMFRTVSTGTITRSDELEETTINASPNGKTAPCAPPICATEAEIPPAMDSLPANEPLSILIVEDDRFMRTTITLMLKSIASAESDSNGLESMPFEMIVHVAESAEEAIGKLYAHRIDLAFVDIQLPGADGYELSQSFSEICTDSSTIFIACSSEIDGEQVHRNCMHDMLYKPVSVSGLRHMVNKWMPRAAIAVTPTLLRPRTQDGSLLRMLYVEDCPISASAARSLLEQFGVQVDIAETGEQALNLLRGARRYHAVIVDLTLPDMSGFAVSSAYKAHCSSIGVKPSVTMALTADPVSSPPSDFGFDRSMSKPLSSMMVQRLLEQWLNSPEQRDQLQHRHDRLDQAQPSPFFTERLH